MLTSSRVSKHVFEGEEDIMDSLNLLPYGQETLSVDQIMLSGRQDKLPLSLPELTLFYSQAN